MNALVAAAKKEGTLNVITLPSNWANYGTIMKDFTAKYGIKINDANPDGSSQDELNAVSQLKGQDRAPDVLDMGTAFAVKGAQQGILAPYKVATWDNIPADAKPPTAPGSPTTAATWPSATTRSGTRTGSTGSAARRSSIARPSGSSPRSRSAA